jgi:hypothetical protein
MAPVLTLVCAGMVIMKAAVEQAVGEDVRVIDGVLAGVQYLAGLCRLGTPSAKRGMYASCGADRKARARADIQGVGIPTLIRDRSMFATPRDMSAYK